MTAAPSRLEELIADRVLWGLDEAEDRELAEFGDVARAELVAYEIAGAEIIQAFLPSAREDVPAHVLAKLELGAHEFLSGARATRDNTPPVRGTAGDGWSPPGERGPSTLFAWSGWLAAAALLLAWFFGSDLDSSTPEAQTSARVSEQLAVLRRSAGVQRLDWDSGPEGEVVWDGREQRGFLVLRGLTANDPTEAQYQLWIFDRTRSDSHPIDGGVFDVAADGEVIVPIDARVPVREAFGFAITREVPGGVVVSARGADGTGQIVAAAGL